jgi:pimeloyl-ACP methyl ester carboxylesterase
MKQDKAITRIPVAIQLLRFGIRSLSAISPSLAGRWVYHLWFATHRFAEPKRETHWREQAQQFTLPHAYGPLAIYSWGEGPTVLLVHGWNGRGTQLGGFAAPLVEAGYRALAFDAPGHGRTPGNCSTIFRIIDAVNVIANEFGPVKGIVTHSFGAMVIARALQTELITEKVVCINPAAQLDFLVDSFCETLGIASRTRKAFLQRLESHYGADIGKQISADENAASLSVPALIIHDVNDSEVPWQQGERLAHAWPGARYMQTRGLGHTRSLRDHKTIQAAVDFISADK